LFEDFHGPIRDRIFTALLISTRTAFTGLALSAFLGITIGIAMSQAKWIERSLWPHLIALQVTPIIAIVPLMIRLIGANFTARVTVTVIISIFPIVSNTLFGIQSVHPSLHDLFRLQNSGPMFITALFATGLGLMLFICFGVLNRLVIGRWHESVAR